MNINTGADISLRKKTRADKFLKTTTKTLFSIAVIGQWAFVYYIVVHFGGTALNGNAVEKWNEGMFNGLIEGDLIGNIALVIHLILAAVITFGGPLQFIPYIRKHFPKFHRWNGRIYFVTAFVISLAGLYMIYTRGVIGGNIMRTGNTINAIMIMFFAYKAWSAAMSRDFVAHRLWAIRTFLVVSGVWFFRIGFGLWIILNGFSAPGSTELLTGPFDIFLSFAHALLPLAIFETYLRLKGKGGIVGRYALAGGMIVLTLLLLTGVVGATMIFWMPSM